MNRLKELRQEKKVSQKAIAEMLAVNEKTVSRWENGESNIKPDKTKALAAYFGVNIAYLLGYSNFSSRNLRELLFCEIKLEDLKKARKNLDWLIEEKERAEHENQF